MNTQIGLLTIGYTCCIFLSLLFTYHLIHKITKAKRSLFIVIVSCVVFSLALLICSTYIQNVPAVYSIAFIGGVILFIILFRFTMLQAYLCGCFVVFHMIALKGLVIGTLSLILKENSFMILQNPNTEISTAIIAQLFYMIIIFVYIKIIDVKALRSFLSNRQQLIAILACHLTLTIFMLFNSFSFYYNLDLVWISVSQILVGIILYFVYIIILNYGIKMADLIQHKLRDQQQLEIIQAQMRQQNSLLKMTEILNHFKHDYREHMLIIEDHIERKQYEEALKETKNDCLELLSELPQTSKYCNNIILNSLLIDRHEVCKENSIRMEALVYYPLDLSISEKECHEILRILTNNAIEANEKVIEQHRYMKIKSNIHKNWLSILVENPYDGIVLFEGDLPISSYERANNEGLGLIYIKELLEDHQGVVHIDHKDNVFKVTILIPIQGNGGEI